MKSIFCQLSFLLLCMTATAQFAGYYISPAKDEKHPEIRLLVEQEGRYHIFVKELYYHGKWKQLSPEKIEITLDNIDPVEVYVSTGNRKSGRISFTGFAGRKAFFKANGDNAFQPIFREVPKCPYENTQQLPISRPACNEITIAINQPDDKAGTPTTLYTFRIPEKYDDIYVDVNTNASRTGNKLVLERTNNQYAIADMPFEKQPANKATMSQWLAEQQRLLAVAGMDKFRKDHYVKTAEVKKVAPEISRKAIRIAGDPIFDIKCPEVDNFPPVEAPRPKKQ